MGQLSFTQQYCGSKFVISKKIVDLIKGVYDIEKYLFSTYYLILIKLPFNKTGNSIN